MDTLFSHWFEDSHFQKPSHEFPAFRQSLCQKLRSTRLGRGSIKSHVRTVKVLGMGLFAFQERVHLWKGVTHYTLYQSRVPRVLRLFGIPAHIACGRCGFAAQKALTNAHPAVCGEEKALLRKCNNLLWHFHPCGLQSVVGSPRGNGCIGCVSGESLCTCVR